MVFFFFFYKISVHLCIPARVLVASPRLPTILLLHSWPPHPSQLPLGLPLAPSAWQSLRFGRSPTSPPWQLLPSAVLSQTASGSDKVTPPATGFGAAGWLAGWLGGWVGGRWRRVRVGRRGGKETTEGSLNEFESVRRMASSRHITELNLLQNSCK